MDEFHFYSSLTVAAWQPLLELPQAQFLLMSATWETSAGSKDLTAAPAASRWSPPPSARCH